MRPIPSARVVDIIPFAATLPTDLTKDFDPDRIFSLLNKPLGGPLGKNLLICTEAIKAIDSAIGRANLILAELHILFLIGYLAIMKSNFRMSQMCFLDDIYWVHK